MAVTNFRLIAQRHESTLFGTCTVSRGPYLFDTTAFSIWAGPHSRDHSQLGAREESWPIESISKISLISGEFWGVALPTLWAAALRCFFMSVALILLREFTAANIQVSSWKTLSQAVRD